MDDHDSGAPPDPAPGGRSWTTLYLLVLVNLAFWIAAFWAFTLAFR